MARIEPVGDWVLLELVEEEGAGEIIPSPAPGNNVPMWPRKDIFQRCAVKDVGPGAIVQGMAMRQSMPCQRGEVVLVEAACLMAVRGHPKKKQFLARAIYIAGKVH